MSDSDYTLLDTLSDVGGSIRRIVDLDTGEVLEDSANEPRRVPFQGGADVGALEGFPLSTVHISPFVEWSSGAGLLKVSQGIKNDAPKGGKRGKVKGFSFASRRRLMQTIAKIKIDSALPDFITLTYPNNFPSPMESKNHLDIFNKRFTRAFPQIGAIWKLEPQERGAPHYHTLAWGANEMDLRQFVPYAWHDIAGGGDPNHLAFHLGMLSNEPCVNAVRSRKGVMRYASKYLGKTFDVAGWEGIYPGRFWGVVQRENIPFGQEMIMYIEENDAHIWMRYQRRFAKLKSRSYSSLTTFCDSDQWVKNILGGVEKKK